MLTQAQIRKLQRRFSFGLASFLARTALQRQLVTYGEVAKRFGGIPNGQGDRLSAIALKCQEHGYPILSVLVVDAGTRLPSVDAAIYSHLGIDTDQKMEAEIERVFEFDWNETPLVREAR